MRVMLGLAVTATVLTGCGSSAEREFTTSIDGVVIPSAGGDTSNGLASPPEVTTTTTTPVAPAPTTDPDPTATPVELLAGPPSVAPPPNETLTPLGAVSDTVLVGNVSNGVFGVDADDDPTLAVQITLDGGAVLEQYLADGTVGDYARFTFQDDPTDRAFVAFSRESDDGLLQALVVSDGGQFNRFFGGGLINQISYTPRTSGLASFAGDYVGLTNLGPLLVTGNGADPAVIPGATTDVTGTVFLNVDFAEGTVNGSVFDRVTTINGDEVALQTIFLTAADFDESGQFEGQVEFGDLDSIGSYNGAVGGNDAVSIAGVVSLGEDFLEGATINGVETTLFDDIEAEAEFGLFLHDQCPAGGAACLDSN